MILIFEASNLCTDIWKTIFVIFEVQFHHEGCLSGSRYFELLFSGWSIFSPYEKSASSDTLFKLFWTFTLILAKLSYKKCDENLLVQNLGLNHLEKCIFCLFGGFIEWKTSVYFCPLFTFFRTLLTLWRQILS